MKISRYALLAFVAAIACGIAMSPVMAQDSAAMHDSKDAMKSSDTMSKDAMSKDKDAMSKDAKKEAHHAKKHHEKNGAEPAASSTSGH